MKNCGSCSTLKDESEFYKNSHKKDGLQTHCKECNTKWVRKRYLNNKEYYDNKNKEARIRNKKFMYNYLLSHPCVDCGEKNPCVLEFDHQNDKRMTISKMVTILCSISSIVKEIKKCKVRCANCHRKKTAKDNNWFKLSGE